MRRRRSWSSLWASWWTSGSHGVLKNESLGEGIKEGIGTRSHHLRPLVPLPPPQEGAIVKHVLGQGVQGPEVPLPGVTRLPRHLDEAVIETEVVADRVLPLGESLPIIGEPFLDKLTDTIEGEPLVRGLDYGHGDQSDVGVGRLAILSIFTKRLLKVILCLNLDVIFNLDAHVDRANTGLIPSETNLTPI